MRLFVALNFPGELRAAVYDAAAPLRMVAPAARWTGAEKLHLTMKFLGERPAEVARAIAPALDAVAARFAPVELRVAGVGAFPSVRRPRILWAGIVASTALAELQKEIDDACAALGFEREGRAFHPHVTLARIGPRVPGTQVQALMHERDRAVIGGSALTRTLDLMESVDGRYVALHRAPLAG